MFKDRMIVWFLEYVFGGALVIVPRRRVGDRPAGQSVFSSICMDGHIPVDCKVVRRLSRGHPDLVRKLNETANAPGKTDR